jgi:cyclic-di-AMP phosphodiesterase PgpH
MAIAANGRKQKKLAKKNNKKKKTEPDGGGKSRAGELFKLAVDRRVIATLCLYAAVCALLMLKHFGGFAYRPGDIAEADIVSPRDFEYVDARATENMKRRAVEQVGAAYTLLPTFRKDVEKIFQLVLESKSYQPDSPESTGIESSLYDIGLSGDTIRALLSLEKDAPVQLRLQTYAVIKRITEETPIGEEALLRLDEDTARYAAEEDIGAALIPAVQDIVRVTAKLNITEDAGATEELRKLTTDKITPVIKKARRNEIIVRKGDPISPRHLNIMRAMGMLNSRTSWAKIAGYMLLIALAFAAVGIYIKTFAIGIYRDEKRLYIFFILVLFVVLWAGMLDRTALFSGYLIGVAAGVMTILTCLLLRPIIALFAAPTLILVVSIVLGMEMKHFLVALVSILAAYFYSVRTQDRAGLMKAGVSISAGSMAAILILTMIDFTGLNREFMNRAFMDVIVFGGLNGLLAFVLATGLMPVFEGAFNVTTPRRLLELSNPEEPLLKRLLIEAPGSYHHSILVGNIAEAAAEAVGADALLTRIACYYHDVGKLKRPYFFVENQLGGGSQLSDVAPTLGALVISSHVKDGVEMAREQKLPDEIVEIIAQHHGTCLISFFFQQAQAEARDGAAVSEERFRYPGPKPQRIESAIIMLADACEAAIRAQKQPTPKSIESTVNNVVDTRLIDKQFDQCNITLKQLDTVRLTLMKTLAGVYHSRMEYPDLEELKHHREVHAKGNGES